MPEARLLRALTMALMLAGAVWGVGVFLDFAGAAGALLEPLPGLRFGVDGLNLYLLLLTVLLFPVVLACAWHTPLARRPLGLAALLVLQGLLLGTFLAQNLLVFFVLWEAVLLPMVLLILVFGGPQRRRAALTFFLYTMAGSVLFLAAVIVLGVQALQQTGHWAFDFSTLLGLRLAPGTQAFVFWAIVLACAVKSPLFPFHSWLPLAYGEAPPAGTALMAGVMSKMGAYGLLRLAIPLCPEAAQQAAPLLQGAAVLSLLYGAVLALRQEDDRQLVAYASLSHMGVIVLGLFSFQATAAQGAMFQILSHGVTVAGLFLMLGLLEERCGRQAQQLQGLAGHAPRFAVVLMLFVLASLALPLTSGFTAEFLVLMGAFGRGLARWQAGGGAGPLLAAVLACAGVVLSASYLLRFARRRVWGRAGPAGADARVHDLGLREALALAPLVVLVLAVGVAPAPWMRKLEPALATLVRPVPAQPTLAEATHAP